MTAAARTHSLGLLIPSCAVFVLFLSLFAPGASRAESPPVGGVHVVAPGETLYSLARRYGVSLEALQAENGIASPQKVQAGARLRIPADGARTQDARTASAGRVQKTAKASGAKPDSRTEVAARWNMPDQTAAIMGTPPKPDSPKSGSLLEIPLKGGGTLSPEHRDAGAVIMSDAASKNEDFQGHALGVRTTLPAGKDTQLVTTLGYGVNVSVKENAASRVGYETDTSIGGLGYGLGIRHSF